MCQNSLVHSAFHSLLGAGSAKISGNKPHPLFLNERSCSARKTASGSKLIDYVKNLTQLMPHHRARQFSVDKCLCPYIYITNCWKSKDPCMYIRTDAEIYCLCAEKPPQIHTQNYSAISNITLFSKCLRVLCHGKYSVWSN